MKKTKVYYVSACNFTLVNESHYDRLTLSFMIPKNCKLNTYINISKLIEQLRKKVEKTFINI